jgi:hypothetical protein
MNYSFDNEISKYINQIESLDESFRLIVPLMDMLKRKAVTDFNEFLDKKGVKNQEDEDVTYDIPLEHSREHRKFKKRLENSKSSYIIIPRSYIVSLISLYDAYLGRLIKTMFLAVPEKLNSSQKQIEFGQLMSFSTLDEARDFIIEKEVETVLRTSHIEQFEWLEKQLGTTLRKGLDSWVNFVEVTERRNLFVHTDGIISSQYIKNCQKNQVKLGKNSKIGNELIVTPKYFRESYNCLFEIGVKLGQVMWRKLRPDEIYEADTNLHNICYNLLTEENYLLVINLLEFYLYTIPKHSSSEVKYRETLNLAQAYKWHGEEEKMQKLLVQHDWGVLANNFRFGYEVLVENYNEASSIMKRIDENEISKSDYLTWPLFKEYRKSEIFKTTYKEKFNEDFIDLEKRDKEEEVVNINENENQETLV